MKSLLSLLTGALLIAGCQSTNNSHGSTPFPNLQEKPANTPQAKVKQQRQHLALNTRNKGFGPQAPRDIDDPVGENIEPFTFAPSSRKMNLCNIHFHKNAEHQGGEFRQFAGYGDGEGYGSGYRYTGILSASERQPVAAPICPSDHGALSVGDTIEVHYVYSGAKVKPGKTLGACLDGSMQQPALRVEAQVYVLVNDAKAANFTQLMQHRVIRGRHQAIRIPKNTGKPVVYAGSTTGPKYNEHASPYKVTWSVRPKVLKVNAKTVGQWCKGNVFHEKKAHGTRNLVQNPTLLSPIH
ncbi:MAG: hypothetical protein CR974_04205 [Gammaproteobacteria bacterium]|nr:MAG: hypothetical protein CR974_04205 [Gammaproteobacteria bacterium]